RADAANRVAAAVGGRADVPDGRTHGPRCRVRPAGTAVDRDTHVTRVRVRRRRREGGDVSADRRRPDPAGVAVVHRGRTTARLPRPVRIRPPVGTAGSDGSPSRPPFLPFLLLHSFPPPFLQSSSVRYPS